MQQQVWTMKIRPHEKLWHIDIKEIWRYRDLIELFVRRNIVVQYKQTILGPLWYLIQPILTVIMNMVVFGGIAKMSTDGMPQALFYMAGNIRQTHSQPIRTCLARSISLVWWCPSLW